MQQLDYTWIENYKYELQSDFFIKLKFTPEEPIYTNLVCFHTDGTLQIKKGFKWDGASGPTIDGKENFRSALVHDALYYLMRKELLSRDSYRKLADELLDELCDFDGMNDLRSDLWYIAVRAGAEASSHASEDSDRQEKVITHIYEDYNI